MNRSETLAKASKDLMLAEPFYGMFLIMLNKMWVGDRIKTAGVGLNGITYQLLINENFWESLNQTLQKGLLKHELLHIAFFHLTDFNDLTDKNVANIAMDLEINQYIDVNWLPPGGQMLTTYPELKLESKKGTRYYYEKLMQAKQNNTSPTLNNVLQAMKDGQPTFETSNGDEMPTPDHSTWDQFEELDEATQKLIKNQTYELLKEVADQISKSRGIVPGEIAEVLKRLAELEEPKFDWRGYLRRFAGGSTNVFTKKSRRKYNVRFEENPGLKIKPKKRILVAVDTSGSVSTNELVEFLGEINHIHRTGTEVTIIQCDSAISYNGKIDHRMD
jgi:predicted metal-dependent peptidase